MSSSTNRCLPRRGWAVVAALVLTVLATPAVLAAGEPTPEEAEAFLEKAEAQLLELLITAERAGWVQATFITEDTELLAAQASSRVVELAVALANKATRFDGLDLPYDTRRKLQLLKLALTLPAPSNPEETAELSRLEASLEAAYGRGEYCPEGGECQDLTALSNTMETSRDPELLLDTWIGWRTIAPPLRDDYARLVELANKGASELGFADLGAMWRSKYDMDPDAFAAELDRLWTQVRPLYEALHCHVRAKLADAYGSELVDPQGPIPAHLLGNMWAQTWANVYSLVAPEDVDPGYDLSALLVERGLDELEMVRYGERFFTSLGFSPLPDTFWTRSMFIQPVDHDAVCHASAWDIDWADDLRIKMCIKINSEDFNTIHHELGHNFYQRAYNQLPLLYRDSANDGFHEAVGDVIALSVTPKYLVDLGFLAEEPAAAADLGLLLRQALDKVAFLPFGLLIDQWRWKVFSGEVSPAEYNQAWWKLRLKYQGIAAPVARGGADFDPGAKYHVPANTPYTRYFLAHILQYQLHRALCAAAGYEGPLNRCSIYANEAAGERVRKLLAMGLSRPWPDALEAVTGQREMDATAILDYFAPLKKWLDEQNRGRTCGW
ncbi:MAG: M2 family metallopeptidase [bacterium]|nr:M2 family metallopeptidase [bacterium]